MWNRTLSKERFATPYERYHACRAVQQALAKVGGKRLVVGHTPQLGGVNCECENQVRAGRAGPQGAQESCERVAIRVFKQGRPAGSIWCTANVPKVCQHGCTCGLLSRSVALTVDPRRPSRVPQVWRVDVGMSYGVLNRPVQVLEIAPAEDGEARVRIIRQSVTSMSSVDDDMGLAGF